MFVCAKCQRQFHYCQVDFVFAQHIIVEYLFQQRASFHCSVQSVKLPKISGIQNIHHHHNDSVRNNKNNSNIIIEKRKLIIKKNAVSDAVAAKCSLAVWLVG